MREYVYPNPLMKSTEERLDTDLIYTYWLYIKLHLQFKLKYKPKFIDYNHVVCVMYDDFWFRITENYKIDIIKANKNAYEEVIEKRLNEVMDIIKKYYPKIYS